MACQPLRLPILPTLPGSITIAPTLPSATFDPALCCKILPFPLGTPAPPIPPLLLNPAVNAAIASVLKSVQDYVDLLPVTCPKE